MAVRDFPRIGFLYDGDADTPPVPAVLDITPERGIQIEVPVASTERLEGYARWFFAAGGRPPEYLVFNDYRADIHLIGCRSVGFAGSARCGTGYLSASYGIEDKDAGPGDYSSVHRVRSKIGGLYDFLGRESKDVDVETGSDGKISGATIRMTRHDSVEIGDLDGVSVSLEPHWRVEYDTRERSSVVEETWFQTESVDPLPLRSHMGAHRSLRDLMALVYWQPLDFIEYQVLHEESPGRLMSGESIGDAWRRVHTQLPRRSRATEPKRLSATEALDAIVEFDQLGTDGLRAWFDIHIHWERAIDPLVGLRFASNPSVDIAVLQSGISLEAYGFLAALEQGLSIKAAKDVSYKERLLSAAKHAPFDVGELVAMDLNDWASDAADAYNGVKHANRSLPDPRDAMLAARTVALLVRTIMLGRLVGAGLDAKRIARTPTWTNIEELYRVRNHRG